jgi:hypothetical protein
MSKRKRGAKPPSEPSVPSVQPEPGPSVSLEPGTRSPEPAERLRRMTVLITETDLQDMQTHFLEGRPGYPLVSVHPPAADAARAYRAAYRKRPEVREKMKAYRALRAARLRNAKAAPATEDCSGEA